MAVALGATQACFGGNALLDARPALNRVALFEELIIDHADGTSSEPGALLADRVGLALSVVLETRSFW